MRQLQVERRTGKFAGQKPTLYAVPHKQPRLIRISSAGLDACGYLLLIAF